MVHIGEQLDDWQAAIRFARTLPAVDPERIAIWGFSVTGGHIFRVAARNPDLAAAIAHSPNADGLAAMRNAMRQWSVMTMSRLTLLGLWDAIGGLFGRDPILVPLTGPRGMVVSLGTPDAQNGPRALNPGNKYPDWQQQVAARSAARVAFYRPGRDASRIQIPLLVLAYDDDGVTPAAPAAQAGQRAPRGEAIRRPGGHYEAFMDGHEEAAEVLLSFLSRHLLDDSHTVQAPGTLPPAEVVGTWVIPVAFRRLWRRGRAVQPTGPVHVSMNDYKVHRARDVPRVAVEGMRFRHAWPRTEGALGLWLALLPGRRSVSVSIWRDPDDLREFVRSPRHLNIMRDYRDAGDLITTTWRTERFDRRMIWRQAEDRLMGRLQGVPHH